MSSSRDRIVEVGTELFLKEGFERTGVDTIAKAAGVTRTTLYNHFASKEELAVAVIEKRDRWWRETLRAALIEAAGDDSVAQLRAVFDVLGEHFASGKFEGCLFINSATTFPNPNDPVHQAARTAVAATARIIADLADEAGFEGPDAFAAQFTLLIEGSIVTELIYREQCAASTAAFLLELLIDHAQRQVREHA